MANKTNYYTPKEIVEILDVSKSAVYRLLKNKTIISVKVGGLYKIPKSKFNTWAKTEFAKDSKK